MPRYRYTAYDPQGNAVSGEVEATGLELVGTYQGILEDIEIENSTPVANP